MKVIFWVFVYSQDLQYQLSSFQMMFQKSREMILLLRQNEHRKATQIIKRT